MDRRVIDAWAFDYIDKLTWSSATIFLLWNIHWWWSGLLVVDESAQNDVFTKNIDKQNSPFSAVVTDRYYVTILFGPFQFMNFTFLQIFKLYNWLLTFYIPNVYLRKLSLIVVSYIAASDVSFVLWNLEAGNAFLVMRVILLNVYFMEKQNDYTI